MQKDNKPEGEIFFIIGASIFSVLFLCLPFYFIFSPLYPTIYHKQSNLYTKINSSIQKEYNISVDILGKDNVPMGSGVIYKNKKGSSIEILTVYHNWKIYGKESLDNKYIVRRCSSPIKERMACDLWIAKQYKADPELDIMLLRGTTNLTESGSEVILASDEGAIGDTISVIGASAGRSKIVSWGHIASFMEVNGLIYIITEAGIWYGNSGGGAFNKNQELIGISSKVQLEETEVRGTHMVTYTYYPVSGYILPIPYIKSFLDSK